ncbi:MAG TPA: hypothetical protein VH497_06460 [Vicinamibacterales bacterium]|jgi:hypothetical protein
MKRCVFASAVVLACSLAFAPPALAQAAKPTPATPAGSTAPAAPAKFVPLLKGAASIQFIQEKPKVVGNDIVTILHVKNMSAGPIGLVHIEEFWYDKNQKQVSGDTEIVKRIDPGQIVNVTMKSPKKPDLYMSQYRFSHVNGKVDLKRVTKFN